MNLRQVVLDTETTGLDPAQDHRIIEIGCIELVNRRITRRQFQCYLCPDRAIDPEAVRVHGLTQAFLADQPRFVEVVEALLTFITGAELIIHNAPFDLGFLQHELRRCGRDPAVIEQLCTVTDTLVLARQRHPGQRNSLDALCKRYNVDNSHRDLHGALLDAEILADVYLAMTRQQDSLFVAPAADAMPLSDAAATAAHVVRSNRAPLPVIRANAEEIAAHEAYLTLLDCSSGEPCVWRRCEAELAP